VCSLPCYNPRALSLSLPCGRADELTRTESDVVMPLINPRKVALHGLSYAFVGESPPWPLHAA